MPLGRTSPRYALTVALVLASTSALADERPANFVDVRAGHAVAWTTGVQQLGHTIGAGYGHTFFRWLRLELRAYYHRGTEMHARGPGVRLDGYASSASLDGFVGYDAWIGKYVELVPGIVLDATLEWDDVHLTSRGIPIETSDRSALFGVGIGLPIVFHVQRVRFGLDPSALFVPTRVAAPMFQVVGVLGLDF